MNYLVVLVAGVILSASLGNCLECYTCNSTSDRCEGKKAKCTVEDQCHLGIWKTAGATIYNAGCMSLAACNKLPAYDDALGSQKCCNTDLCNASDRVKLSLLLFPTLVSVWFAIFM